MTDQPARVTPREIADLLAALERLGPRAPLAERLAWQERKAELLSRIADGLGTAEAHEVAADAWARLARLAREADDQMEVRS